MTVRAKFKVKSITLTPGWREGEGCLSQIILEPVISGSAENKAFFAATPLGKIEISTVNEKAAEEFNPGDDYYVDFTKAD